MFPRALFGLFMENCTKLSFDIIKYPHYLFPQYIFFIHQFSSQKRHWKLRYLIYWNFHWIQRIVWKKYSSAINLVSQQLSKRYFWKCYGKRLCVRSDFFPSTAEATTGSHWYQAIGHHQKPLPFIYDDDDDDDDDDDGMGFKAPEAHGGYRHTVPGQTS